MTNLFICFVTEFRVIYIVLEIAVLWFALLLAHLLENPPSFTRASRSAKSGPPCGDDGATGAGGGSEAIVGATAGVEVVAIGAATVRPAGFVAAGGARSG